MISAKEPFGGAFDGAAEGFGAAFAGAAFMGAGFAGAVGLVAATGTFLGAGLGDAGLRLVVGAGLDKVLSTPGGAGAL